MSCKAISRSQFHIVNLRDYFDQIAAQWDGILEEKMMTARLREIVAGLSIEPRAAVLDVGCGTGVLFPMLLEKVGRDGHIVALDISSKMLKHAKIKGHPVTHIQGDAQWLPFPAKTFDWVVCNAVFPHFSDKLGALREIHRVLKDGGRLVICHANNREAVNEIHQTIGGVVARDTIPPEEETRRLLREARLDKIIVRNEPDRYLVLAHRQTSKVFATQP